MNPVVSDLFFNHEHPKWEASIKVKNKETGETTSNHETAIHEDADEFVKLYGSVFTEKVDPKELAEDFLERL